MKQFRICFHQALLVILTLAFLMTAGAGPGRSQSSQPQPEVSCEARFEGLRTHVSRMENNLRETQTALELCRRPPPGSAQTIAELQSLEGSIEARFARVQKLLEKFGN
jgi:hypothetical protein